LRRGPEDAVPALPGGPSSGGVGGQRRRGSALRGSHGNASFTPRAATTEGYGSGESGPEQQATREPRDRLRRHGRRTWFYTWAGALVALLVILIALVVADETIGPAKSADSERDRVSEPTGKSLQNGISVRDVRGMTRPAVVCATTSDKRCRFAGTFTGATGLEPATSGVTGRHSQAFREPGVAVPVA
jgi:hypothetical protein